MRGKVHSDGLLKFLESRRWGRYKRSDIWFTKIKGLLLVLIMYVFLLLYIYITAALKINKWGTQRQIVHRQNYAKVTR